MQVTDSPLALPNTCLFCPGSQRERYIDTEIQVEFHGAIYICELCVVAMGRMMGMLSRDQVEMLIEDVAARDTEIYNLKRINAGLEDIARGMATLGLQPVSEHRDPDVLSPDAQGQGIVSDDSGNDVPGEGSRMGTGEGTPPESSDDEQLDGVRSDDSVNGDEFRLSI